MAVDRMSDSYLKEKQQLLGMVRRQPDELRWAPLKFRGDEDVVLEASKRDGFALSSASRELLQSRDFALKAVKINGRCLEFVSKELRGDREVVVEALRNCGCALKHVRHTLADDLDIALEAVRQNWLALGFVSPRLLLEKEVILAAARSRKDNARRPDQRPREGAAGAPLMYAAPSLRSERAFVLELVNLDGLNLEFAAPELQEDPMLAVQAARHRLPGTVGIELPATEFFQGPEFAAARDSSVAGEGDPALLLSVTIAAHSSGDNNSSNSRVAWQSQGTLLSGANLHVDLAEKATVNVLAKAFVNEIQKLPDTQCVVVPRVFLVLKDNDNKVLSPFDANRPISSFVSR